MKEDTFLQLAQQDVYTITSAYFDSQSDTWFIELQYQGVAYWAEVFWEDWDWEACYGLEKDSFDEDTALEITEQKKTLTISMGILGTYAVHGYWLQLRFALDLGKHLLCLYDESKEHLHNAQWVQDAVAAHQQFPINNLFTIHIDIDETKGKTELQVAGLSRFGLEDRRREVLVAPVDESDLEGINQVRKAMNELIDRSSEDVFKEVQLGQFNQCIPHQFLEKIH